MEPTTTASTQPDFFTDSAIEFFTINDIVDYQFYDAETAVTFIYTIDEMIDAFITRIIDDEIPLSALLLLHLGSALGEAYKLIFNGQWYFNENVERWVVQFTMPGGDIFEVNVFSKIMKRFENGDEDLVSYMFDTIKALFLERLEEGEGGLGG